MNFGSKDANGADGIVFIFAASPGLGTGGGGIGYQGLPQSIGVEIDDYQNGGFGDPAADHFGIESNGSMNHNLAGPNTLPNIEMGDPGSGSTSVSKRYQTSNCSRMGTLRNSST